MSSFSFCLPILVFSFVFGVPAFAATPVITGPLYAGDTTVSGATDPGAQVSLCELALSPTPVPTCSAASASFVKAIAADGAGAFSITGIAPLKQGYVVYVSSVPPGGAATTSTLMSIGAAIPTTITLSTDNASITNLQEDTVYATMTSTPVDVAHPIAGYVQFFDNGLPLGASQPVNNGLAQYAISVNGVISKTSSHNITAVFQPGAGAHYATSTASAIKVDSSGNEREHTDFVAGAVFTLNGNNYSQGNTFLAMNYDRTIYRPGWYSPTPNRHPGWNSFFQARLTSIPVNTSQTTIQTTTPAGGSGSGTSSTPTTSTSVSSFLSAQKVGQFGGGIYFPFLFGKVPSYLEMKQKQQAFFFGPIAAFGFATPASPPGNATSSVSTTSTGDTVTTQNIPTNAGTTSNSASQLYDYWYLGARIGTAELQYGSIYIVHRFDMGFGKFSNLQSLICQSPGSSTSNVSFVNGSCQTSGAGSSGTVLASPTQESRATMWRLFFEGYMEVQTTTNSSLILGISANYGPGLFSQTRKNFDPNNRAKDDLEFLLGYKFDVTQLLAAVPALGTR